jgi:hypothetical protein
MPFELHHSAAADAFVLAKKELFSRHSALCRKKLGKISIFMTTTGLSELATCKHFQWQTSDERLWRAKKARKDFLCKFLCSLMCLTPVPKETFPPSTLSWLNENVQVP